MRIVFDLDGTLADCRGRLHYIKAPEVQDVNAPPFKADWDGFYKACVGDSPITSMLKTLATFSESQYHSVEIWTGRVSSVRRMTEMWLSRQLPALQYTTIRMRPVGDHQEDYKLKESWLLAAIAADQKPDLVFEDRQQCVDMYRGYGILVCQVAKGKF